MVGDAIAHGHAAAQGDEVLRLATAIRTGTVTASAMLLDNAGLHTRADLDTLLDTIGARCRDRTERQSEIGSRTASASWPQR